ncbi:molybdopterin-dependent oxidoreductase [Uliginosibacterium sp. 31-12]|uniref:molybdopterin-containing oxidoreductase family protein n=1 Tax=Uliginosibacterium sp. 31-12 TaxID=3062781 RepID=UPI0026E2D0C1|nr:molybdopterin oxidoreductase family protein [Uliginosibacterium sp. 31-12]MDO6387558.1 molybdopterin oxidoreductase family protein [Uliginosibacterium sp. 31-12]
MSDRRRSVRAVCPHDCPDTCAMQVTVEDGRATAVRGAPDVAITRGTLCSKVAHYLERTYSEQRLLYPMKRVGKKGEGRFERISWELALDTIAERFRQLAATDPRSILPYSYAGTMGLVQGSSMDRRFFHRLGASFLDRTICAEAGYQGYKATIGATLGTDPEAFADAPYILIWGSNPVVSNLHLWARIVEAKRKGARVVCIDPVRSLTAEKSDWHLAPLPGTDGALALALMHVLIRDGLVDEDYVARYTTGYAALKRRVADWTPERAAGETGLAAADIEQLAREYGQDGRPAAIRVNYGLNRCAGGGSAMRAISCLPALTGHWRWPQGGILLSTSGTYGTDSHALERPDLYPCDSRFPPRHINMSAIGDALLEADDPAIRAIMVYNSNPVAVAPDSNKVRAGFAREDLFCVVHELFQTDTADFADILLPATSQLEQWDIHKSYGHLNVMVNEPAIASLGEARPNTWVFRELARRMCFTEPCFAETDEEIGAQAFRKEHPRSGNIDMASLQAQGWQRLNVPTPYAPFAEGGFLTPSGKCEFYSDTLAHQGIDPLPHYVPPREGPRSNPALAAKYPLAFVSPPSRHFLNSSFANLPRFVAAEGKPWLDMHPADAAARGLQNGARVRIFNARGAFHASLRVDAIHPGVREGVVSAPSIWWQKLSGDGCNANAVTSQAPTDLGKGATFYDCLVEVTAATD